MKRRLRRRGQSAAWWLSILGSLALHVGCNRNGAAQLEQGEGVSYRVVPTKDASVRTAAFAGADGSASVGSPSALDPDAPLATEESADSVGDGGILDGSLTDATLRDAAVLSAGLRDGSSVNADAADAADPPQGINTAIVISVDGLASRVVEELLALSRLPAFARLVEEGSSTFNARAEARISFTVPNHTSMLTGRAALPSPALGPLAHHGVTYNSDTGGTVHDSNPNLRYTPSAFDAAHDRGGYTSLYAGKPKFALFQRSYSEPAARPDIIGEDDGPNKIDDFSIMANSEALVPEFLDRLYEGVRLNPLGPNFSMLHIRETDSIGHGSGWGGPEYLDAVFLADRLIGDVMARIEGSELFSHTVLIITADHGGVGYGHSDPNDVLVSRIPFLVWGKGVAAGVELYEGCGQTRVDPAQDSPLDTLPLQPIRNGDAGNLALRLLGLPVLEGSHHQAWEMPSLDEDGECPVEVTGDAGLPPLNTDAALPSEVGGGGVPAAEGDAARNVGAAGAQ